MDRYFPFFFPVFWLTLNLAISVVLGFMGLYSAFPRVDEPIEETFWWVQLSRTFGHAPVTVKFGTSCLHVREVLLFRPLFWQGPASIPYDRMRISKPSKDGFWGAFSRAQFEIPELDYRFRLSGSAGRLLESRLAARDSIASSAGGAAPIRPR